MSKSSILDSGITAERILFMEKSKVLQLLNRYFTTYFGLNHAAIVFNFKTLGEGRHGGIRIISPLAWAVHYNPGRRFGR
jgi:hypothetical protein